MTNQADTESLLEEVDIFSWADSSKKSEDEPKPLPAPVPPPMTPERKLDIVYSIFSNYAARKHSAYPDMIMRDLRLAGVAISGYEELLCVFNSLAGYFLITKDDRLFTFSLQDAENKCVKKSKPPLLKAVIFSVLALAVFVSVSVVAVSMANSREEFFDEASQVKDFPVATVAKPIGSLELVEKTQAPISNQGIFDSINALIDSGRFALALELIRNSTDLVGSDFVIKTKKTINVLVLLKADSLGQVIKDLVQEKKYFEAFELEQHFDKDVFQLKGTAFARQLRQDLISEWVYSYKGLVSSERAMEDVTEQIRNILKSPNYEVARGEGGKFYLEYSPSKNSKKS